MYHNRAAHRSLQRHHHTKVEDRPAEGLGEAVGVWVHRRDGGGGRQRCLQVGQVVDRMRAGMISLAIDVQFTKTYRRCVVHGTLAAEVTGSSIQASCWCC